jgi:hypothetical protein
MNFVVIILTALFGLLLILFLSILLYHPKAYPIQPVKADPLEDTQDLPVLEKKTSDYSAIAQSTFKEIRLLWPKTLTALETETLPHALLFHWKGASRELGDILFVNEHYRLRTALFSAVDALVQSHTMPSRSFWIALPLSRRYRKEAMEEVDQTLIDHHVTIDTVLQEGSDNEDLCGYGQFHALIGVGLGAMRHYRVSGEHAEWWVSHLDTDRLFPLAMNESAHKTIQAFGKQIPFMIRLELRLPVFEKKGIEDLLVMMPDLDVFFGASSRYEDRDLWISAMDREHLKKACAALEADAQARSLSLEVIEETKEVKAHFSTESLDLISHACTHAMRLRGTVPCLLPRSTQLCSRLAGHKIWYAPMNAGRKEVPSAAIAFYQYLIEHVPVHQDQV